MISIVILRTRVRGLSSEHGDTIVEVMIAMVLISLVIVGAYVASNSSLNNVRDAQERNEALSIAQSQIESLRYNNGLSVPNGTPTPAVANCFANGAGIAYEACTFGNGGAISCVSSGMYQNANYCYTVKDSLVSSTKDVAGGVTFSTYKVNVTWPALTGGVNGQDTVTLYYRLDTNTATGASTV